MWDGLLLLLTLSSIMALASFLAGSLPLSFSLSQRQLRSITAVGTGVLVGTALIIIIPEGIETLYSSSSKAHQAAVAELKATQEGNAPVKGGQGALTLHRFDNPGNRPDGTQVTKGERSAIQELFDTSNTIIVKRDDEDGIPQPGSKEDPKEKAKQKQEQKDHEEEEGEEDEEEIHSDYESPHAWVGISLILGYILMYLIDTLPQLSSTSRSTPRPMHISLSNLSRGVHDADSPHANGNVPASDLESAPPSPYPPSQNSGSSTTIGLVIHALADGIALGASSSSPSSRASLGFVVFLALMLHKAPAAFGLTAVLLKRGMSKRGARAHLMIFSLAAPIGAILTWAAVNALGAEGGGDALEQMETGMGEAAGMWWTGVVLIFSGGTFLYVAMHSMQDAHSSGHSAATSNINSHSYTYSEHELSAAANGYSDSSLIDPYNTYGRGSGSRGKISTSGKETLLTVLGMLLPLLTQLGHAHGH
ncbi:Zip-domain-containing protein [Aulographum hederae CBS 113979]|uniref:Zip-domain-containing protein n=1 Tax=Aulographum hederae CBS 113979 TaxID=1176131 RepID=A0A6G1H4D5_9PEZI|nr:Zip-domain-containing protein [Aulographum hederae CBS 113979]